MTAYCELSLTTGGHRVRIADLSSITLTAFVTDGLKPIARRLMVDANGYELFNCPVSPATEHSSVELPDNLPIDSSGAKWFVAASQVRRD